MKGSKFIFVGILATGALLFTGCTAKESKLICTKTVDDEIRYYNIIFKGNIINEITWSNDKDLSKYTDLQIEAIDKIDFCTKYKDTLTENKEAFINCEQTINNKTLKIKANFDINIIAKKEKDKMTTPEKGKENLEKDGYTCTIEK